MKTVDEIKKGLECCRGINAPCEGCPYNMETLDYDESISKLHDDALTYIRQLEAEVPKWISVEESLPAPHEDVAIIIRHHGYTYLRVGWYGHACQWMQAGLGMIEGDVTHWMPLPEAPKEE